MTSVNDPPQSDTDEPDTPQNTFGTQDQRRNFIIWVYIWATIYIILTLTEWMTFVLDKDAEEFIDENGFIMLVAMVLAFAFVLIFSNCKAIRYKAPYNWIFISLIVISVSTSLLQSPPKVFVWRIAICFVVTAAVYILIASISFLIPVDLTAYNQVRVVINFFVYFILFISIKITEYTGQSMIFPSPLLIIALLMNIFFDSQLISGSRMYTFQLKDYSMAILVVHLNFIFFCCIFLIIVKEW